jgi:hypothetical protein
MPILISVGLPCARTGAASITVAVAAASAVFRNCIEILPGYIGFARGLGGCLVVFALSGDVTQFCLCWPSEVSRETWFLSSEHRRWGNASGFSSGRLERDRAQFGVADQVGDIVHDAEGRPLPTWCDSDRTV